MYSRELQTLMRGFLMTLPKGKKIEASFFKAPDYEAAEYYVFWALQPMAIEMLGQAGVTSKELDNIWRQIIQNCIKFEVSVTDPVIDKAKALKFPNVNVLQRAVDL